MIVWGNRRDRGNGVIFETKKPVDEICVATESGYEHVRNSGSCQT